MQKLKSFHNKVMELHFLPLSYYTSNLVSKVRFQIASILHYWSLPPAILCVLYTAFVMSAWLLRRLVSYYCTTKLTSSTFQVRQENSILYYHQIILYFNRATTIPYALFKFLSPYINFLHHIYKICFDTLKMWLVMLAVISIVSIFPGCIPVLWVCCVEQSTINCCGSYYSFIDINSLYWLCVCTYLFLVLYLYSVLYYSSFAHRAPLKNQY